MLERARTGGELALPETVQGIIAARLDALAAEREGAAPGRRRDRQGLLARRARGVDGAGRWRVERGLHALERKEFVRRERRSSVAGESEYAFRHVLVRDVAYGQIPRAERAEKHRRAAEWIESLAPAARTTPSCSRTTTSSALEFAPPRARTTAALAERAPSGAARGRRPGGGAQRLRGAARTSTARRSSSGHTTIRERAQAPVRLRQTRAITPRRAGSSSSMRLVDQLLAAGDQALAAAAEIMLAELEGGPLETAGPTAVELRQRAAELVHGEPPSRSKALVLTNISRFLMLAGDPEAITRRSPGARARRAARARRPPRPRTRQHRRRA